MPKSFKDITFTIQGKNFACRWWNAEVKNAAPIIALHGWLDNLNSFNELAPLLGHPVLAVDMAGHGHSDHRSRDASYHIWDDVREVLLLADAMQLEQFILLGHSRGGIIAAMTAAITASIAPGRVQQLVLVEGFWPQTMQEADAPQQLGNFVRCWLEHLPRLGGSGGMETRGREDIDIMVQARIRSGFAITDQAARLLVERNVVSREGLFYWRTDPRLVMPSPLMLTDNEARAFLEAIRCPALLIIARDGLGKSKDYLEPRLASCKHFNVMIQDGGHHLHLEAQAGKVAEAIQHFLATTR